LCGPRITPNRHGRTDMHQDANSWDNAAELRKSVAKVIYDAGVDAYDEEGDAADIADALLKKFTIIPRTDAKEDKCAEE